MTEVNKNINYETERIYSPSETSELLGINDNTLRTWAGKLKKVGYIFYTNKQNHRAYFRWDIDCLKEIQRLIHEEKQSQEDAILISARKYASNNSKNSGVTPPSGAIELKTDEIRLSKQDLMEVVENAVREAVKKERESWENQQDEKIEAMYLALEEKMKDAGERRDRYLVAQFNESLEQKRLEVAAAEEAREAEKSSFLKRTLSKFFGQQAK